MKDGQRSLLQRSALRRPLTEATGDKPAAEWMDRLGRSEVTLAVVKDLAQWHGVPTWRAVMTRPSMMTDGLAVSPALWGPVDLEARQAFLLDLLDGVGRPQRTRVFLTHSSLVVTREISGTEWEALAVEFHDADPLPPMVPVKILVEPGPGETPLPVRPCVQGGNVGPECPCMPCSARRRLESERQRVRRQKREADREREGYEHFITTPAGKRWLREQDERNREEGKY